MVVSLDIEEFERGAALFGFVRVPGDDGPGELVQVRAVLTCSLPGMRPHGHFACIAWCLRLLTV